VRANLIILAMVKQDDSTRRDFPKDIVAKTACNIPAGPRSDVLDRRAGPARQAAAGTGRAAPAYSAGVADTASAGIVTGSASRRNRRQAMRMSRNSLTQALGVRKWDSNSRFVSSGIQ
jgi:hypothetical protein